MPLFQLSWKGTSVARLAKRLPRRLVSVAQPSFVVNVSAFAVVFAALSKFRKIEDAEGLTFIFCHCEVGGFVDAFTINE